MDKEKEKTKKPVPAANNQPKASVGDYFKGVRTEMRKVVWPTRKELGSYTGVVLFTCFIMGLGIWIIDTGVLAALKYILNITF